MRALGLDAFPAAADAGAAALVGRLVEQGYDVIFYTADLAPFLAPLLERHRRATVPAIMEISNFKSQIGNLKSEIAPPRSSSGRLKELLRRAVGADVFGQGGDQGKPKSRT